MDRPASATDGDVALRLAAIGTPGHILGTDEQGRDMLTRLLHGARLTLLAGIVPVLGAGLDRRRRWASSPATSAAGRTR